MNEAEGEGVFVLNGRALLHKFRWAKGVAYKQLPEQYVKYVRNKFGQCHVVFDGYDAGPSIKDHEHQRRSLDNSKSAEIIIMEKNIATDRK